MDELLMLLKAKGAGRMSAFDFRPRHGPREGGWFFHQGTRKSCESSETCLPRLELPAAGWESMERPYDPSFYFFLAGSPAFAFCEGLGFAFFVRTSRQADKGNSTQSITLSLPGFASGAKPRSGDMEPVTLQAEVPEGVGPGVNFNVSTPDGQVLQLTCPDEVCAGMMVSFAYYPIEAADESGGVRLHDDDRRRLEEGAAIAAARQEELNAAGVVMAVPPPPMEEFEGFSFPAASFAAGQNAIVTRSSGEVFLTALGPLYTVYLGQAEDGEYVTKNCEESDLRSPAAPCFASSSRAVRFARAVLWCVTLTRLFRSLDQEVNTDRDPSARLLRQLRNSRSRAQAAELKLQEPPLECGKEVASAQAACLEEKMLELKALKERLAEQMQAEDEASPSHVMWSPDCISWAGSRRSTMSNRWAPPLWRAASAARAPRPARACASAAALPARVGVVGCGQMGTGIAIVAARHPRLEVVALDAFPASLERSKAFVAEWAAKEAKKGRMSETEVADFLQLLSFGSLEDEAFLRAVVPGLDFVIEAVSEDLEVKQSCYGALEAAGLREQSILASNTSSISITKLASQVSRPERVIGMHFMNPVPVMPLVEVIRGLRTDEATLQSTLRLCRAMKKEHSTSEDRPGFIANRVLMPYINEAVFALQEGVGTAEDIDKTLKLGTNVPMGPLTLADFIGLDTCLSIMRAAQRNHGLSLGELFGPFGGTFQSLALGISVSAQSLERQVAIEGLKVRFTDAEAALQLSALQAEQLSAWAVESSGAARDSANSAAAASARKPLEAPSPWYEQWRKALFTSLRWSEHEALDQPLAALLVVQSTEEDPAGQLEQLLHSSRMPPLCSTGVLDPVPGKAAVLLHDPKDPQSPSEEQLAGKLRELKARFAPNLVLSVQINGAGGLEPRACGDGEEPEVEET
ncbi:unnamed protein product [Effrenium voratum]|nr:unnamed protein product [Effrenium voratum]